MTRSAQTRRASGGLILGALGALALMAVACDSDYTLDPETPPVIPTPTPSPTPGRPVPPPYSVTPTEGFGDHEPGKWEPSLRVEPPVADFGALFDQCERRVPLKVYNDGDVPMTITHVYLEQPTELLDITLYSDLSVLYPGEEGNIRLDGVAEDLGVDSGELWIVATEGNYPAARVPVVGEIVLGLEERIDSYLQEPANKVDVLWVIDNSGSMGEDQKLLAANFQSFMEAFARLDIEYHMGVVTTDMTRPDQSGRLQGDFRGGKHYIDWTMRDEGLDDFTRAIVAIGAGGSGSEQGLWAAEGATSFPLIDTWNAGFIRDDAYFSIIFLSDEEDQSPGDPTDPTTPPEVYYLDHLVNVKGGIQNLVANAIVSFTQPQGYVQVAVATGGYVYPIKSSYDDILVDISWVSAGYRTVFPLSEPVGPGGILQVFVNDTEILPGPTTWSYDGERQAVAFDPSSMPPDGAIIDLRYQVRVDCETAEAPSAEAAAKAAPPSSPAAPAAPGAPAPILPKATLEGHGAPALAR